MKDYYRRATPMFPEVGSAKILTLDSETIEVTFMSNIFNVIGISSITIY